jgi:multidrug efflux pump subunit AcrB
VNLEDLKEELREKVKAKVPDIQLSFEPIELTDKILSQGSPTPIEVRISGRNKKNNEEYAKKVVDKLNELPYLRDVQIGQSTNYPAINISIDRVRAAQLGIDIAEISRSITASTSSSRYTDKSVWIDEKSNQTYSVQVQVPENQLKSIQDIGEIPITRNASRPVLSDVATITQVKRMAKMTT